LPENTSAKCFALDGTDVKLTWLGRYDRLTFACHFESFLATKYGVTKRFGLEGVESSIPGMKALIDRAVEMGPTPATRTPPDTLCLKP
jgi:hypothetical protein